MYNGVQNSLLKYLNKFKTLRVDRAHGVAPHKPVLLISVLQAFQNGLITSPEIFISPELVALFRTNWSALVTTSHDCKFALPFYYMTSEGFWKLIPNEGFENLLQLKGSMRSFGNLNAAVQSAVIDEDLYSLFQDRNSNSILIQHLLDEYFSESKVNFVMTSYGQQRIFNEIEGKILYENPEEYRKEIKQLMIENNDEEIYIRGSLFKREIPKIYNYTCCISEMKIDATINVSMVDACHIVPFRESYNDTVTNGIALCPNLHRAFDRGLISIDKNYRVIVSQSFVEDETNYSIGIFNRKRILLPKQEEYFPMMENLAWHRGNVFK